MAKRGLRGSQGGPKRGQKGSILGVRPPKTRFLAKIAKIHFLTPFFHLFFTSETGFQNVKNLNPKITRLDDFSLMSKMGFFTISSVRDTFESKIEKWSPKKDEKWGQKIIYRIWVLENGVDFVRGTPYGMHETHSNLAQNHPFLPFLTVLGGWRSDFRRPPYLFEPKFRGSPGTPKKGSFWPFLTPLGTPKMALFDPFLAVLADSGHFGQNPRSTSN